MEIKTFLQESFERVEETIDEIGEDKVHSDVKKHLEVASGHLESALMELEGIAKGADNE